MLLSIIIPLYNKEPYIAETLESVVCFPDSEILIIDDKSTDGGRCICDNFKEKYANIKIIDGMHNGVSAARNLGIQQAQGEYLCFLDADDRYESRFFADIINILTTVQPGVLVTGYLTFRDAVDSVQDIYKLSMDSGRVSAKNMGKFMTDIFEKTIAYNVSTKIYKTSVIKEKQIRFDENLKYLEDVSFFIDYVSTTDDIYYFNALFHCYRQGVPNSSISAMKVNGNYLLIFLEHLKKLYSSRLIQSRNTQNHILSRCACRYYSHNEILSAEENSTMKAKIRRAVGFNFICTYKSCLGFFLTFYLPPFKR